MSALLLFWRLLVRPLAQEPLRTSLTVLSVALGVAVVVAIDLAGDAAAGSFHSSLESLTGKGDLLITQTAGLDEHLLGRLVELPYPLEFQPRIEAFATVNGKGEALPFIGLDLIGNGQARIGSFGNFERPIWAGAALNWHNGQNVRLLINDVLTDFTVAGVLPGEENNVIVTDIGLAQTITKRLGHLDAIDVKLPSSGSVDSWRRLLEKQLPRGVRVEPQGSRTDENRKMLRAFRWNLRVLSYIALVVGAFLIYNTIAISVVRRRNEIGVVRALGGARESILSGFLAEALFFGFCGSVLGLLLGRALATGAVKLVGNTVQALYVSSRPAAVHFSLESIAAGVGMGLLVSVIAALAPAVEAARVPPLEAMARGREEFSRRQGAGKRAWMALLLFGVAALFTRLPPIQGQPVFAYLAVLFLVIGTAAVIPEILGASVRASRRMLMRVAGVEAFLAAQSIEAALGRLEG